MTKVSLAPSHDVAASLRAQRGGLSPSPPRSAAT
jgi:hypothetical protein